MSHSQKMNYTIHFSYLQTAVTAQYVNFTLITTIILHIKFNCNAAPCMQPQQPAIIPEHLCSSCHQNNPTVLPRT